MYICIDSVHVTYIRLNDSWTIILTTYIICVSAASTTAKRSGKFYDVVNLPYNKTTCTVSAVNTLLGAQGWITDDVHLTIDLYLSVTGVRNIRSELSAVEVVRY